MGVSVFLVLFASLSENKEVEPVEQKRGFQKCEKKVRKKKWKKKKGSGKPRGLEACLS